MDALVGEGAEGSMSRYLKARELCPIHHSFFCEPCHKPQKLSSSPGRGGRKFESSPRMRPPRFSPASVIVDDPHSERGFREECNPQERSRRKRALIAKQEGICACGCGEKFTDWRDAELDHIDGSKMGGAWHDDSWQNLQVLKRSCHAKKTGLPQWTQFKGIA